MKFVGHRGASAVKPESTMSAFMRAVALGLSFECDLQVIRTGEVVVLHDSTLERTAAEYNPATAGGLDKEAYQALVTMPAANLTLDDMREIDVGSASDPTSSSHTTRVPTFAQALHAVKKVDDDEIGVLAEVKSETGETGDPSPDHKMSELDGQLVEAAEKVASESHLPPAKLTWISFSRAVACEMKRRMPEHKSLLIAHARTTEGAWQAARECVESGLDGVDLEADAEVVTSELVAWLHARGKVVAVWVYRAPAMGDTSPLGVSRMSSNDTPELWGAMRDAGVDVFTSNLPPELEKWREAEVA